MPAATRASARIRAHPTINECERRQTQTALKPRHPPSRAIWIAHIIRFVPVHERGAASAPIMYHRAEYAIVADCDAPNHGVAALPIQRATHSKRHRRGALRGPAAFVVIVAWLARTSRGQALIEILVRTTATRSEQISARPSPADSANRHLRRLNQTPRIRAVAHVAMNLRLNRTLLSRMTAHASRRLRQNAAAACAARMNHRAW